VSQNAILLRFSQIKAGWFESQVQALQRAPFHESNISHSVAPSSGLLNRPFLSGPAVRFVRAQSNFACQSPGNPQYISLMELS